jgi:hypothetical protein
MKNEMMEEVWLVSWNVNPGVINPKRLFKWEGTIKKIKS